MHSSIRISSLSVDAVAAEEKAPGQRNPEFGYGAFGRNFVEGDHRRGHRTGGVRNPHHVEVTLQTAVLARCAVNQNQGVVESFAVAVDGDREVVFIDLPLPSVGRRVVPVAAVQVDEGYVVFRRIERRCDLCGALERDLPFRGVAARHQGNVESFHIRGCRCPYAGTKEFHRSFPRIAGPPGGRDRFAVPG